MGDVNISFSFSAGYLPGSEMMLSNYGIERSWAESLPTCENS